MSEPPTERVDAPAVRARRVPEILSGRLTFGVAALLVLGLGVVLLNVRSPATVIADASPAASSAPSPVAGQPSADGGETGPSINPDTAAATTDPYAQTTAPPTTGSDPGPTSGATAKPASTPTRPPTDPPGTDLPPTDLPETAPPTQAPPTIHVTIEIVDWCFAPNGTETVFVEASWTGNVPVTSVDLWLDDTELVVPVFSKGEYEAVVSSQESLVIGTTHTAKVRLRNGSGIVAGPLTSAPFTVEQGSSCPDLRTPSP